MSNTPETDQLEECDQYKVDEDYAEYNAYRRMVEHARKLERELDRLAEALRMITTFDYTDLQCDNGHGARSVATEALQSLTQNK